MNRYWIKYLGDGWDIWDERWGWTVAGLVDYLCREFHGTKPEKWEITQNKRS